jgi:hypothetical protein
MGVGGGVRPVVALRLHSLMVAYEIKSPPYLVQIDTEQLPLPVPAESLEVSPFG